MLANRSYRLTAVIYIALDNLKPVNDIGEHKVGDSVLQKVVPCVFLQYLNSPVIDFDEELSPILTNRESITVFNQ